MERDSCEESNEDLTETVYQFQKVATHLKATNDSLYSIAQVNLQRAERAEEEKDDLQQVADQNIENVMRLERKVGRKTTTNRILLTGLAFTTGYIILKR